jgi:hypothetical protein
MIVMTFHRRAWVGMCGQQLIKTGLRTIGPDCRTARQAASLTQLRLLQLEDSHTTSSTQLNSQPPFPQHYNKTGIITKLWTPPLLLQNGK